MKINRNDQNVKFDAIFDYFTWLWLGLDLVQGENVILFILILIGGHTLDRRN